MLVDQRTASEEPSPVLYMVEENFREIYSLFLLAALGAIVNDILDWHQCKSSDAQEIRSPSHVLWATLIESLIPDYHRSYPNISNVGGGCLMMEL